jgi:Cd2+/Zn2+-exporting ATPase
VPETLRYRVASGSCLECSGDLAGTLRAVPGAEQVQVLAGPDVVTVSHDGRLDDDAVRRAAAQHNLTLLAVGEPEGGDERPWWRDPFVVTMAVAAVLLAVTLVGEYVVGSETLATVFGAATIVVGGAHYVREAFAALRARRLAFVQLLVLAVVGAVVLGVVEEAAMLVVVYSLGELLEAWVAHRARRSLRSLMDLVPATARRHGPDGAEALVPVRALAVGKLVLVRPGERLPTDGLVRAGCSAVDQSAVTGESIPVEVTPGSEVFGGTVNGTGALEVEVSRPYEDTTLARVIRQVEDAQANKGSAQRFADRFGAKYTPAVVAIALGVAVLGPLLGGDVREWVYRALVVLVVSCSCALVVSVPTAVVAAVTRGARDGILIRGGAFLETLATVRTVAFDKTGTLTQGRPRLTDVVSLNGASDHDIVRLAASVEAASEHPLAGAVLAGARERGLTWPTATDARAEPGVGVHARVGSEQLFVGRPDAAATADGPLHALSAAGKTVMAVARGGEPIGLLAVADELRTPSRAVIEELHQLGVQRVVMLTGDHEQVACAIARAAGVDDVRAQLLPQDKSAAVAQLAKDSGRSRWSGTASTTRPRSPSPTSASPWAPAARPWRWRPRTSRSWPTSSTSCPPPSGSRAARCATCTRTSRCRSPASSCW